MNRFKKRSESRRLKTAFAQISLGHHAMDSGANSGFSQACGQGLSVTRTAPSSLLPCACAWAAAFGGQSNGTLSTSRPPTSRAAYPISL